jgi:hypothetical protein
MQRSRRVGHAAAMRFTQTVTGPARSAHRPVALALCLALLAGPACRSGEAGADIDKAALEALAHRLHDDAVLLRRTAGQTNRLRAAIAARQALFARDKTTPLGADERLEATTLFADVLDHIHLLDGVGRAHFAAWKRDPLPQQRTQAQHFQLGFLTYLEKLTLGLALVEQTLNKPQFEKLLDEGSPELGIPAGIYSQLKWNVVHVERVAKILGAHQFHKLIASARAELLGDPLWGFVHARIDERYDEARATLTRRAPKLFGGNAADIGLDLAHAAWFPVQANTAEWLGDTKVRRKATMLIAAPQVDEAIGKSEPGDIIVERRNWYLSNVGLPGFWPHAALWVGSPAELAAWADDDDVKAAFGGSLPAHLESRFPAAWQAFTTPDHEGHSRRVLEAISEGVVFNSAEESIHADYVAALRPRRSKVERARALVHAFAYFGRPYDFDFDFFTDTSLVCSELVVKAYEPRADFTGLSFSLERVVGRMTLGPNSIVRTFDAQHGTDDAQLDFVYFLDGQEKSRRAVFADEAALRASWRRPKWDVAQK